MAESLTKYISPLWAALIISLLASLVYLPILDGKFAWDDHVLIINNLENIDDWGDAIDNFTQPVLEHEEDRKVSYYRPVLMASFTADFILFGKDPGAFHRTNVILHGLNTLLLCLVLMRLTGSYFPALLGGLLFGLHPINAQVVSLILGRNDLLLFFFFFLGILCFDAYHRARNPARLLLHLALLGCYALVLWTKETGVVLPAALLLIHLFIYKANLAGLRNHLVFYLSFIPVAGAYFWARNAALGHLISAGEYGSPTLVQKLLTMVATLGYYLKKTLFPSELAAAPYYAGMIDSSSGDFLLTLLLVLFFILLSLWLAWRRSNLAAAVLLYSLCLLPVLGLVTAKIPILEHRTYLSIGCVGLLFAQCCQHYVVPHKGNVAVALAALAFLALITHRNVPNYRTELELWSKAVKNAPYSLYANGEYSHVLLKNNRYSAALVQAEKTYRLNPNSKRITRQLASAYEYNASPKNNYRERALYLLNRILDQQPEDFSSIRSIAIILDKAGRFEESAHWVLKGLELENDHPLFLELLPSLSLALADENKPEEAIEILQAGLALSPQNPEFQKALNNLIPEEKPPHTS